MAANKLHAYRTWRWRDGHIQQIWFVSSAVNRLRVARRLVGPNPGVKAARDFRGPLREGLVAYGHWVKQPEL